MEQPPKIEGAFSPPPAMYDQNTLLLRHLSAGVTGMAADEGAPKHHWFKQLLICSKHPQCPVLSLHCSPALEEEFASNWRVPKFCNKSGWLPSPAAEMEVQSAPWTAFYQRIHHRHCKALGKDSPVPKEQGWLDQQELGTKEQLPARCAASLLVQRLLTPPLALDSSGSSTPPLETGSSL